MRPTHRLRQPFYVWTIVAMAVSLPAGAPAEPSADVCRPPTDTDLSAFQIGHMEPAVQCQLGRVINGHTTRGTVGPVETPVALELAEYLLDRPVITAALVERLGIGAYRFVPRGPRRFWVEDGEGTEGFITLVQQRNGFRTYYIEGNHHGHILPTVHATAVVFMKLEPIPAKTATVSTMLISYARLDDRLLRGLVWLLRPLLEDAITRKLTRGFEASYLLGQRIAEEPARIHQEVPTLPFAGADDARRFVSLLPPPASPARPTEPIPNP